MPISFTKERIELDKNENYWDGDVGFKHVVVDSINDVNTRAMALQAGDIDMAVNTPLVSMDYLKIIRIILLKKPHHCAL